ncbi:hypothetical protein AXG93_4443s1010 [Marchantia polymorpha subsp. ruderalis]|uniref:Retrotransposon gag domain-containing protein n=1 Tax=Marchantia polymorpha subsp. ruderalis TaxID=1480154 RepID=A0A176VVW9_MARPO|nr:hypothetical protein AXG93_4443s1010 [Marchantia polymorpha subsp. ruderalis]
MVRFRELGYDSRVLTKLRNLQREKKESLRDYTERFQDLLDTIPKTRPGFSFSVQQAVDWYVTGLTREIKTFCRRRKCDTIEDVIASAEAFETSTLNQRGRERRDSKERKPKGGRRKRRVATPSSEEQSLDEGCTSSEEEETSSSEEEKKRKKRGATKKKGPRRANMDRASGDIASKVETLIKDFADLKVDVSGHHRIMGKTPSTMARRAKRQPLANRPTVRFVTTPAKEDVQVNQVEASSDKNDEEEEWPAEEVMCGRVETRSSRRSKEEERDNRKHSRKADDRKGKGEEKASSRSDLRPARKPSAIRETPAARTDTQVEDEPVRVLKREYTPDIRDEVAELLKEAIRTRKETEGRNIPTPSVARTSASLEQRKSSASSRHAHYDVVEDIGNQRANITFKQLLEDNKTYRRMLMLSLSRPRKPRATKLLQVYQVINEDQGRPEIDVEIGGCCVRKVPVDSGSGVNIMTEDTARALGFSVFEPTKRVLRLADQTRRMPAGMLRNVKTTIGGADFRLTYIILQPMMKQGYDVLLGRPWLYGAQVRCDWRRHRLKFPHPKYPSRTITVPWTKIPHEGETPSTSAGYTSEADSDLSIRSDYWTPEIVGFVACCSVEEELDAIQPEDE